MKLDELASKDLKTRLLLSDLAVSLPSYQEDVANGLPFFSGEELAQIERDHKDTGLTFAEIKSHLAKKGMILKPATFKKYLGMGMIPGTSNIKRTGKANIGYYPARIIRDINFIKYSLYANLSFDDLLKSSVDALSMNLFAFIERLNPEALTPLIDWEAIWDIKENVSKTAGTLLADGQISREEMESIKSKSAAFEKASGVFFRAQKELNSCLEGIQVKGEYALQELDPTTAMIRKLQGMPPEEQEAYIAELGKKIRKN